MNLDALILPSFAQMMDALSGQLAKAAEHTSAQGNGPDDLLKLRLAEDMLPLSNQIQFVCQQAREARAWLTDTKAEDAAPITTLADAQALLASAAAELRQTAEEIGDVDEARPVDLVLGNGMRFDLDVAEYFRSWAIPQFYFHLVTAYGILRHHGVDLGKGDYVPHIRHFFHKG